ncbi:MAG: metalloregulator ArsR/SmtB family transcription factor [Thermodesulfobacteriota bacterium]
MPKRKVSLADWERVEKATEILKTVAHPLRLRIVDLLAGGERTVGDIQNQLGVSQSLTSQQLSLMKSRGVLKSRRMGKLTYYSIERPEVIQVLHCLRKC